MSKQVILDTSNEEIIRNVRILKDVIGNMREDIKVPSVDMLVKHNRILISESIYNTLCYRRAGGKAILIPGKNNYLKDNDPVTWVIRELVCG